MKLFSAQYVYTNLGPPLVRPLIATHDDGTVISVTDTGGNLPEKATLAYYNGIIVPGFVNCHCHLELSGFKGLVENSTGLPGFIDAIRRLRETITADDEAAAVKYDAVMASGGVVACADISNGTGSFAAKGNSSIHYISLIEVFGVNPAAAGRRFGDALAVAAEAQARSLTHNITPHSAYAMSVPLLKMIRNYTQGTPVTSIHFMESEAEARLLEKHEGPLMDSYSRFGVDAATLSLPESHADTALNHIRPDGSLILVHNTFADGDTVDAVNQRKNTYWCLCPDSNMFISGVMPPVDMLREKECKIVIGTDSLASNSKLSILSELITISEAFPTIETGELIRWATINGAEALGIESWAGTIEPGKRPGLLLIEGSDLSVPALTRKSKVKRLI
ncbi:MAG: amidohydrolase family protein [Bacteroidales bacterium]|nr:amidohydrolase family protein [Bacteroidales bacterium]